MNLILQRRLEKQLLSEPEGLTVEGLLNEIYELIDSGAINKNARIVFNTAMYAIFMCKNCNYHNEKEYNKKIVKWKVSKGSKYNELQIIIN